MVRDGRTSVAGRRVGAALLFAAMAHAAHPGAAAVSGDVTTEGEPLTLCTAPWPPFVESVPPPRPPAAKPVCMDRGRLSASEVDGQGAHIPTPDSDAPPEEVGDEEIVLPPPLPEHPRFASGDGDTAHAPEAPNAVIMATLTNAGAVASVVVPPVIPRVKRAARVAEAFGQERWRLATSVVRQGAPPGPVTGEGEGEGDGADQAADDDTVASEEAREAGPGVGAATADGDDIEAGDAATGGISSEADGAADDVAMVDEAPDDPPEELESGEPRLQTLRMPTARALLPQGRAGGPMTELVQAACREAGLNCRIVLVPWIRARGHLESGQCDGVFPVEETDKTRTFMRLSRPLIESRLAFFTMNTDIHRVKDLTEYIVLVSGPSEEEHEARAVVETLDKSAVVMGPDLDSLIRRLSGLEPVDRVALFGNYHVISRAMESSDVPIPALNVVRHRGQSLRVGFALNRVPDAVRRAFDNGVNLIERTRVLREILEIGDIDAVN